MKNTFFNGDPDYFKTQLRGWIDDLGISSADVQNLTTSALLTKLMTKADDNGLKSIIRQAQAAVKDSGIGDITAGTFLKSSSKK